MKQTVAADYAGAGATHDTRGEFMLRARDRRDADRAVVIHMTYEQMVDARDRLTALIDNPPAWTRAGRERATADAEDLDACTCIEFCDQDPATACSLSGTPHVHPEIPGHPGVYGPCPVHPNRPGDH
jgi:hypothetical protein